jgi:glycine C-acetyltransferase
LFSNALPPTVAASALAAVQLLEQQPERVERLRDNTRYFREAMIEAGLEPIPGDTPIVPIIVGETATAIAMSDRMLQRGVFVTGFGYPVVPHGTARIRCQISAAHTRADLDEAITTIRDVARELGVI